MKCYLICRNDAQNTFGRVKFNPGFPQTWKCFWVLVTILIVSVAGCHYNTAHVWRPLLQNVRDPFTLSLLGPIVAFKLAVRRLVLNWLKQRGPVLVTFDTIIVLETCLVWPLKSRPGTTPTQLRLWDPRRGPTGFQQKCDAIDFWQILPHV